MKFATNSLAPNMASEGKKENGTRSHVIAVDGSRGSAEGKSESWETKARN